MLYMFLADGFEETEAIGTLDVIRRAEIEIATVGLNQDMIKGSHGVLIKADVEKAEIDLENIDGVILPGGMPGTTNLQNDETVINTIKYCAERKLLVAAICAAPMVLGQLGILEGKKAVCYPGFEKYLKGAEILDKLVAVDGNIITGKGAGASMLFGAEIVNFFKPEAGVEILKQMQHI